MGSSETKSKNKRILTIYDYIKDHEWYDDDYWYAVGNDHLLGFLTGFDHSDHLELEVDLPGWTMAHLEIFGKALTLDRIDDMYKGYLIKERSYLYAFIFTIADQETFYQLIDSLENTLVPGEVKPMHILKSISFRLKDYQENKGVLQAEENRLHYFTRER